MKSIKIYLLILLTSVFIFYSCSEEQKKQTNQKETGVYVKTMKVDIEPFTSYIDLIGVANANHMANIGSNEGGRIENFVHDKGSYVKKGEVIVEIENDILKANLDAAKSKYEQSETNFQKQKSVYEDSVTSEIQFLNSKYERDQAKANYDLIKARYEKTFVKAPFSGIVDKKFVEVGELALPNAPIVSLVSMGVIKVEAGVPEIHVNKVQRGDDVVVIFPDLDSLTFNEKISFVGHTISKDNRTFPIEIIINNRGGKIKPQLKAVVKIQTGVYENIVKIPESIVTKTDLGNIVFVYNDGKAQMRVVDIVSRKGDQVAVKSGLKKGDQAITVGYQDLVDGEKVIIAD